MAEAEEAERGRAGWLRRDAERISGALPPLLAEAERLAASVVQGVHGRRLPGMGESFWQYRKASPGDPMTSIDWRRSARSDKLYIREMEWEAAQTVWLWVDDAKSMDYRSEDASRTKHDRGALLALALGVLLIRGGERVSLVGTDAERPAGGEAQLRRMSAALSSAPDPDDDTRPDYGGAPRVRYARGGRVVFFSDFMGPRDTVFDALRYAADSGVSGAYVQVMDPWEEGFPFDGRLIFESMGGAVEFETQRAAALRDAYRQRLVERRAALNDMARRASWRSLSHRTDESPRKALLWLYTAIGGRASGRW
jgi:uncharacterized protein (DUF58 family)